MKWARKSRAMISGRFLLGATIIMPLMLAASFVFVRAAPSEFLINGLVIEFGLFCFLEVMFFLFWMTGVTWTAFKQNKWEESEVSSVPKRKLSLLTRIFLCGAGVGAFFGLFSGDGLGVLIGAALFGIFFCGIAFGGAAVYRFFFHTTSMRITSGSTGETANGSRNEG